MLDLLIVLGKIAILVGCLLGGAAFLTWVERKQSAAMQDRIGPNRADIFGFTLWGLFHPIADGIKMLVKEDLRPRFADPYIFPIAPLLAFFPAMVAFAVIPWGGTLKFGAEPDLLLIPLQLADLNVGILFIFAVASISVYGVILGGWSSANKWSLLGGMRGASQMLSYEVSMGLSAMGIFMIYETMSLAKIAQAQGDLFFGFIPAWGIVLQPAAFVLFMVAAIAETKRVPFDLPESESELIAGYFLEYSGMKFGLFFMGEFIEIIVAGSIITTLFLGSYQIPYLGPEGLQIPGLELWAMGPNFIAILQCMAFLVKTAAMVFLLQSIRWTLPRFRYDQLMKLGWKVLFPLAIANLLVTAILCLLLT